VDLEARADVPSSQEAPGGTATTAIYAGAAVPCFHANVFAACALAVLGGQVSRGENLAIAREATTFYAAVGVRGALEIPVARKLELDIEADLLATLTRAVLETDDGTVLFRGPPVSGALHLGLLGYFK